jgi:hypothetical protein
MTFTEAMKLIEVVKYEQGLGLLETLKHMDRNLFVYDEEYRTAFRIVMNDFRKLFA